MRGRALVALAAAAGAADAATGLALVAVPGLVAALLELPAPAEPVYLRFLGVFVAGVGFACLYPFLLADRGRRQPRLAAALEWTSGVRLAVALFVAVAVSAGELAANWLAVGFFDALVAIAQLALLARETVDDGG